MRLCMGTWWCCRKSRSGYGLVGGVGLRCVLPNTCIGREELAKPNIAMQTCTAGNLGLFINVLNTPISVVNSDNCMPHIEGSYETLFITGNCLHCYPGP